jgi:NAD(P)-dependent dehydrogenase (short-subunit alcohol dehydrogenase family)
VPGLATGNSISAQTTAVGPLTVEAWDVLGGIDVLVNNAAVPKRRVVTALEPDEVASVMRVNFFAPMRLTLAVLPRINVSSVGGRLGIIHEPATVQASSPCADGANRSPWTCTAQGYR